MAARPGYRSSDTGRRDQELCAQRGQSSWAQARSLLTSNALPRSLRRAWLAGRVLPAAYATVATSVAFSARATAPLEGFFDRAARCLASSWQFGHMLTKHSLMLLAGLSAPQHATVLARVRLVVQLCSQAPPPVWDIFDACWNRATPWVDLLLEALRQVWPAIRSPTGSPPLYLSLVRQNTHQLAKECRHLSRYGTAYSAFWALWRDLQTPRRRQVVGQETTLRCPLCTAILPSKHALAAHCHRKHTIVNHLTKFTAGTVCLWCLTDHFSTDRLKYHLRTSRACIRGLRVVVGESYEYGSGTKRSGSRPHRGLPPQRRQGPLNATPLQRASALVGRIPSEDELHAEFQHIVGADDEYSWPPLQSADATSSQVLPAPGPGAHIIAAVHVPGDHTSLGSQQPVWRRFAAACPQSRQFPSPHWHGLAAELLCLGLPQQWHRFWSLWHSAEFSAASWSWHNRRAQRLLRVCQDALARSASPLPTLPSLDDLLAATITFLRACQLVLRQGLIWIPGVPSTVGLQLFRRLLPTARFHFVSSGAGRLFVASHPQLDVRLWHSRLSGAQPHHLYNDEPLGRFLQPAVIYHPRSPDSAPEH